MEYDLSNRVLETPDQLWDVLTEFFNLPEWFGRNFDAWHDALQGGITEAIDGSSVVVIRVARNGLFRFTVGWAGMYIEATEAGGRGSVIVGPPTDKSMIG